MVAYGERRMDETPLVARALAGDEAAVAALYDRYADKLYDYARFLAGSSTDAGDITHDVFLVAMQRLSQLRDHAKFRPWVYAIMRTEVSRRRLRASRLHLGAWDDNRPLADLVADARRDPSGPFALRLVRHAARGERARRA